jgi:ADP-heptose:LPS heptosyltransferase
MKQFCPRPVQFEGAQRIAIVRRNLLGDLLCCKPMMSRLRQLAPQAELTLFGDRGQRALLPYLPEVDQFVDVGISHSKLMAGVALGRRLRGKYDIALCARGHPNRWCNLFLYALGAPQRGSHIAVDWERCWINRPLWGDTSYQSRTHQALKSYHLVDPTAPQVPPELYPKIIIPQSVRDQYASWLAQELEFGPVEAPILLLSVSNNRDHCLLTTERTLQAVHRLAAQFPLRVVISARKSEEQQAQELAQQLKLPARAIATESLDALLMLLEAVHCLFIGEGGLMHLAAALGKRQLALFGQSSPLEWWPMSSKARWISHALHVNAIPQEAIERELLRAWND